MARLVIAIDCDDVLVPGTEHTVMMYNRRWGTRVSLDQAHNANAVEWATDKEDIRRRIDDIYLSDEYAKMEPYREAVEAVNRLARNYELHMVTARPESIKNVTERMVEKYFPGCFSSVRHVGFYGSKGDICEAVKAGILVDDNLRHLINAKECGVETLIWFGNYPWQTEAPEQELVAARCYDWPSAEVEIAKFAL